MTTFVEKLLAGQVDEEDIYDFIDEWDEESSGQELHEFLGMTWPEYCAWTSEGDLENLDDRRHGGLKLVALQGGEQIMAHGVARCERPCAIHWPRQHHMRSWPQHWRSDRGIIERVCDHGVGHPDPDDKNRDTVHGCDGCCVGRGPEVRA